eukprot:12904469-Prorocentrum_lima.AAC.1
MTDDNWLLATLPRKMGGLGVYTLRLLREAAPIAAWQRARGRVAELSDLPAPEAAHGPGIVNLVRFQELVVEYNEQIQDPAARAIDCHTLSDRDDTLAGL